MKSRQKKTASLGQTARRAIQGDTRQALKSHINAAAVMRLCHFGIARYCVLIFSQFFAAVKFAAVKVDAKDGV